MDKSEVITLATYASAGEALVVQSLLESAGVETQIVNEVSSNVLPYSSDNAVRLIINEKDVDRAREILAAGFDKRAAEGE